MQKYILTYLLRYTRGIVDVCSVLGISYHGFILTAIPIFVRISSLLRTLKLIYDCPSASEINLIDMGTIKQYQTINNAKRANYSGWLQYIKSINCIHIGVKRMTSNQHRSWHSIPMSLFRVQTGLQTCRLRWFSYIHTDIICIVAFCSACIYVPNLYYGKLYFTKRWNSPTISQYPI